MQFKINFLYHTCYNVFQFPRENCNDRFTGNHHLASSLSQECKGILKFTPITAQYQHRIDVCCLFINLESIYSQLVKLVKKKRFRLLIYPSLKCSLMFQLIVLVYILILVVNIDQSTSSFICYTLFKKLKLPQIKQTVSFISSMITFFLFSNLNYRYINTNSTKFSFTCHIVQRHDPQEDILFSKIT